MTREQLIRSVVALYALALVVALGSLIPWSHLHKSGAAARTGSVAKVHISGTIQYNMKSSAFSGPDAEDVAQQLHKLSTNDDVKAIILFINSPGGTVGAVQDIHTEILRCQSHGKIVVASLGDVAASGGYYLASAADRIVSEPGTIVGSIGVILEFGNFEKLLQRWGIDWEVVKSGAHKDIGSPARPLTPEEKRLLQASIDDAYAQFVDAVAKGRHVPVEKIKPIADGRIFTGRQAMAEGLIDELGNPEDALQVAIKLAHLPEKPTIIGDTPHSLAGLMQKMSTEFSHTPLETLSDAWKGPQLDYLWR